MLTVNSRFLEEELFKSAERLFNMTPTAQIGLIVQNPRQWALEVVNERYTLPTSDHYMDAIGEYVIVSNLNCNRLLESTIFLAS